jgi:two-component system phosphate regulon sensor histidine kinase PhoR
MQKMMDENKELLIKAIESEKLKTEFFTNISHEFKTPLNVILGVMQLVNIQNGNEYNNKSMEAYNKYLPIMKQNCFRLLRLINNLLDITKIEAGYLELNFKNHDIIKIIEDVTLSVAEYAKNNSISIIFDTEIEERVMRCDEEKIERIILNLLSNSIKYNKDTGEIYVNVYDKKESILISIRDTGIGIPKERLGEVFERFKRVDTSLHRINEGTGIGLALVKSLVEKHGGEISVNSKYGEGTEFLIELPVILLPEMKNQSNYISPNNSLVERINIEFSDIYKLN